jgi:OOP family OmpA-OmpF porin
MRHGAAAWLDHFSRESQLKKFFAAAALLALSGMASAQGYAGALIGMSKFDVDCSPFTCDKSDTAFKVYGGYNLSKQTAIEVGFTKFGAVSISGRNLVDASALSVVGAFRMPITPSLNGVARLGLGFVNVDSNYTESESAVNLYAGLGLEYAITKTLKVVGAAELADNGDVFLFGAGLQADF